MSDEIDWKDVEAKAAAGKETKILAQRVLDLLQEIRTAEKDRDLARNEINKMQQDFNLQSAQLEKLGQELKKASKVAVPTSEVTELKNKIATMDADNKSKSQFIAQLEKDVTDARNKMEEVKGKAKAGEGADAKIKDLESKLGEKEKEIADLQDKVKDIDALKSEFDKVKASFAAAPGLEAFEKEKADFESEKKKLFKEMEDFEVSLRMEMEQKDQKIKELEDQVKELKEHPVAAPSMVAARAAEPALRPSKESLIAKLGLERVEPKRMPAGKDFAFPGVGEKTEVAPMASGDQRVVCPKCGNTNVKVESDRSRVLSYMGGVPYYAKKYVCKKCATDFRVD
nr:hypothetical protein [Candidatus Sigynarchaeota archaeon]